MTGAGERIDAVVLVQLLADWAGGDGPLYRQLADALERLIAGGELPGGVRLPPERALADALPAARSTVVAAFGVLTERGAVQRRQGSGTTVRGGATSSVDRPSLAAGLRAQTLSGRALSTSRATIQLGLSVLDDPWTLPAAAFEVDPRTLANAGGGHGYAPLGIPALRDRVAELLTAVGVDTVPEEVAITLGAQHGISLAAEALAGRGGAVALEDPTYPGAIDVYSRAGHRLLPIRVDAGGTDPASLRSVLARETVDVVHLAPQCASPTGTVTAAGRLDEIADLLAGDDAWLIEDAALQFLAPQESLQFLTARRPDRSVLVGTVSKVFWGGLRVGWLRAPVPVVERVGRLRAAHDLGSSIAPQVTALRLLDDLEEIGARRRAEAGDRRRHLAARIGERLPDVVCHEPDGGLSLWLGVPAAERVVTEAGRRGLDVVAGPVCSVSNGCTDRLRISAWAPFDVLDAAVDRLADAIDAASRETSGTP